MADTPTPSFLPPVRWTAEQTAAYLGIKVQTLAVWRATGRYQLPFIKVGRLVRYDPAACEKWLAGRTQGAEAEAK